MSTARFCRLLGVPERSYRRWQQRQRNGRPVKGPWPTPSADRIEPDAVAYADRYPQWGSRTIATLMRIDGHLRPRLDRVPGVEAHRQGAGGRLPGRTAPARRGPPGRVRGAAVGPEPGLAARLHGVRDPDGRHLADRRDRRLLVEARARLARLTDPEPPRRDRDRRASRSPRPNGCSAARSLDARHRPRHRRDPAGRARHRQRALLQVRPLRRASSTSTPS